MQSEESFEAKCAEVWEQNLGHVVDPADESRMLTQLLGQIRSEERHSARVSKRTMWLSVAAAFAFVLTLGAAVWGWARYSELNSVQDELVIRADKGQKTRVTLPDGSIVNLNSDSELLYLSSFNRLDRNISLSGEAYFEVAKNAELPFVVKAGDVSVKALGTKFNVSAYPEDASVTATLTEGKVMAWAGESSCTLVPGEAFVWNKLSGKFSKDKVASQTHLVPWMENQLYLDNESFDHLAKSISRMYNVELVYDNADVEQLRFTGLVRNSSLVSVLDLICATSTLKYRMDNNIIYFYNK